MQNEGITPQIKKLEQIKLSPSRESRTADKFTTKKQQHKNQCRILRSL